MLKKGEEEMKENKRNFLSFLRHLMRKSLSTVSFFFLLLLLTQSQASVPFQTFAFSTQGASWQDNLSPSSGAANPQIIRRAHPEECTVDYIFELCPDPKKTDPARDLKLWLPVPCESASQSDVEILSIKPLPQSRFIDPDYGNEILYWDFATVPEQAVYRVEIRVRFVSYELSTWVDSAKVQPYNTDSPEYSLYTRSSATIHITPAIKTMAKMIIAEEDNPYLQAKQICYAVSECIQYKILDHERGRGIDCLLAHPIKNPDSDTQFYEGSCSQYSALFVALCRSVGIPARCVFAYFGPRQRISRTEEELEPFYDFENEKSASGLAGVQHYGVLIPHMWAEFYVQDIGWVPVDAMVDMFGYLPSGNMMKMIVGKGRDIYLGSGALEAERDGYGSQWVPLRNGRADYLFAGVWNISTIDTAKVKIVYPYEKKPITDQLRQTIEERGLAAARTEYENLKSRSAEFNVGVTQVNFLAKELQRDGKLDEAMAVYGWLLEDVPDWYETYMGMAEVHLERGRPEEAIRHYAKALELNPTRSFTVSIREALKRITEDIE